MKEIEKILEEYGQEDLAKRLDLFMEHRELRTAFVHMEMEEVLSESAPVAGATAKGPEKRRAPLYSCRRLLKWCFSRMA